MRQWISIRGPGGMRMGQSIGPEDFGPPKLPSWRRYELRRQLQTAATAKGKTMTIADCDYDCAEADARGKAHDRVAVNASQALNGANATAFGESGNNTNLLVVRKNVHGANPWVAGLAGSRTLESPRRSCYMHRTVIAQGAKSLGF
jgi:hypothetical protein